MNALTLRQQKTALRRQTAMWQWATAGLFALSLIVNLCQTARLTALERTQAETAAQLRQAERTRDLAVRQLGEVTLRAQQDAEARAAQAAAYEAVGGYRYIGACTIAAYCACEECCGRWADGITATGLPAEPGIVAVDPEVIPLGSTVIIDGQKYLAADTGSGVTGNHVDVFMVDHAATVEHGVQSADVWVVEP